jgi:hypothetical protein
MSLHNEWKSAKTEAKKYNNGKDVKFKADLKLGAALDKLEAAEKVHEKEDNVGPAWAKATDAWVAAGAAAHKIAVTYQQQLPDLKINDMARKKLDTFLVFHIFSKTNHIKKEAQRLEPMLKKHRKA